MHLSILRGSILLMALGASSASAQSLVGQTASPPLVPSAMRGEAVFSLPDAAVVNEAPLKWGLVDFRPHLSERFLYSDGVPAGTGSTNTYINSLSLGVAAEIGKHWMVDYSPTWMIYTNRSFENSVDHVLSAHAGYEFGDWFSDFQQEYSKTNTPRIETGRQTAQENSLTTLSLSHRFTDHLSIEFSGSQSLQFIDQSPDSYDWSGQGWIVYRVMTRLEFSVGYRLGYTDFDPGAYMTSATPQARMRWRVGDKLALNLQVGREHRQVHKSGFPAQNSPTYDGSVSYQPFDHTCVTAGTNRQVMPSSFSNGVTDTRGWHVDVEQRLFEEFTLSAGYSRSNVHYLGSHTALDANYDFVPVFDDDGNLVYFMTVVTYTPFTAIDIRNDSTRTYNVRLSTSLLKRATLAVFYNATRNLSDIGNYSLNSHQVGVEIGYRF